MSHLIATVSQIESCDSLHIVKFKFHRQTLSMMSLDLNEKIEVGTKVRLIIKASHIAIAKNFSGDFSHSNQLSSKITAIENGKLLSSIELSFFDTTLESIITLNSSLKMNLQVGDSVVAFVKASELSIGDILDV